MEKGAGVVWREMRFVLNNLLQFIILQEILAYTPESHPDYNNLHTFSLHLRQIVKKLTDDQNQHEYMKLVSKIRGLKVFLHEIPL